MCLDAKKKQLLTFKEKLSNSDLVFFLPFRENTSVYLYQFQGCNGLHISVTKTVGCIPWLGMWLCARELDSSKSLSCPNTSLSAALNLLKVIKPSRANPRLAFNTLPLFQQLLLLLISQFLAMREVKKMVGLSFMSYGTLYCLQGSLLEGRSTQFM